MTWQTWKLKKLTNIQYKVLDELMSSFVLSGTYFAFFKNVERSLVIKYHIYDKTFVEYKGEPKKLLSIRYSISGSKSTDDLIEMYPGIYVRSFVLFFGDELDYEIVDSDGSVLDSGNRTFTDIPILDSKGRYQRLNSMQNAYVYSNDKELISEMKEYQGLLTVTDSLFSLL